MDGFTDTHCHLNLNFYQNDLIEVLDRANQQGVRRILIPGVDLQTSLRAVELCEKHTQLYAAVGIHPNDALTWSSTSIVLLKALAQLPCVLAIGEIGLDYYRDFAPADLQREIFAAQLDLAEEMDKPVVVHSRASMADVWQKLETWRQRLVAHKSPLAANPGVLHSYDGDLDTALKAIDLGFLIGISGPVTYKNAKERQQLVSVLPLESLLIETDAPYLTPHPFRGQRNEPGFVVKVAEKIAELHNLPVSEVARVTSANADRVFGWRRID